MPPLAMPERSGIVRSETKITGAVLEAGKILRAVGRAGVGVDNVDIELRHQTWRGRAQRLRRQHLFHARHASSLCSRSRARFRRPRQRSQRIVAAENFQGVQLRKGPRHHPHGPHRRRAVQTGDRLRHARPRVRYLSSATRAQPSGRVVDDLDDLLAGSDFSSLHTPLTPETHHLLNGARLAKTRGGVRIINCARGGLIDEIALIDALASG